MKSKHDIEKEYFKCANQIRARIAGINEHLTLLANRYAAGLTDQNDLDRMTTCLDHIEAARAAIVYRKAINLGSGE